MKRRNPSGRPPATATAAVERPPLRPTTLLMLALGSLVAVWGIWTWPQFQPAGDASTSRGTAEQSAAAPQLWDEVTRQIRADRLSEAEAQLEAARQQPLSTNQEIQLLNLAITLRLQRGDHDVAIHDCRRLIELAPDDPQSWRQLLAVYQDGGYDAARMVEPLQWLAEQDDNDAVGFRVRLVDALIAAGDRHAARKHFDALSATVPGYLERQRLTAARLLALEGRHDDALALLQQIGDDHRQLAEALLLRGRWSLQLARLEDAEMALQRLLQLDPSEPEAHYLMGQLAARQGDPRRAQTHWDQQQRLVDARQRIPQLEQQLASSPENRQLREELRQLYLELGLSEYAEYLQQLD